jgi:hypothetical protein
MQLHAQWNTGLQRQWRAAVQHKEQPTLHASSSVVAARDTTLGAVVGRQQWLSPFLAGAGRGRVVQLRPGAGLCV